MKPATAFALLCVAATAARADMGIPGFKRVPTRVEIELVGDPSGYKFWLVGNGPTELMTAEPGSPARLTAPSLDRAFGFVIMAAPAALADGEDPSGQWQPRLRGGNPPWVLRCDAQSLSKASVPFYDSRDHVVERYRLEVNPDQGMQLVHLGRDPEPLPARIVRYVVGVALFAAFALGGIWLIRRIRRRPK